MSTARSASAAMVDVGFAVEFVGKTLLPRMKRVLVVVGAAVFVDHRGGCRRAVSGNCKQTQYKGSFDSTAY